MAPPPDTVSALKGAFPSLASRAGKDLPRLAGDLALHQPAAGARVLAENEPHDSLFLICEGEVAVECTVGGAVVRVGTLGKSRWFGEIGFLEGGTSTAGVVATAPALILALSRPQFMGYLQDHPVLADAILGELIPGMSQRLRVTREVLDRGDAPLRDTEMPRRSLLGRALRALTGGA